MGGAAQNRLTRFTAFMKILFRLCTPSGRPTYNMKGRSRFFSPVPT